MGTKHYTREQLEDMDIDLLDLMAFGVVGGQTIEILPKDIKVIYSCDLGNPQHKFQQGGMAWVNSVDLSEPVQISVNNEGEFCLEDGHHRLFAATMTKKPLQAHIEIKGKPIERILANQAEQSVPRKRKTP